MSDILIRGGDLLPASLNIPQPAINDNAGVNNFSAVLKGAIEDINNLQNKADEAIAKVQMDSTASIHEAVIALEKADTSFRAMMQVRNKIVEAYQEIMRIQV